MAIIIGFDGKNIYSENQYNYPVVTEFTEREYNFIKHVENALSECFNNDFPIRIERHSQDYLSMIVGEYTDFLRFKCTERTKWFSVSLSPAKRKEEGIETRFATCKPTIRHWKAKLRTIEDITAYSDIVMDAYLYAVISVKL